MAGPQEGNRVSLCRETVWTEVKLVWCSFKLRGGIMEFVNGAVLQRELVVRVHDRTSGPVPIHAFPM